MKENGFVQEPMAEETTTDIVNQNAAEINNSSFLGINESPEFATLSPVKLKGVPKFKLKALYRSRLRVCIFLNFCLVLVMFFSLSEDIFDRMGVFILELEELYIPKPLPVQYLYTIRIIFSLVALRALSHNLNSLKTYAAGTVVFSILPLIGAAIYFFRDIVDYAYNRDEANIEKWLGYPIAVYFYIFTLISLQVDLFSLYFTSELLKTKIKTI